VLVQERAGVYTLRGTSKRRIALEPARSTLPTPGGVRVGTKKRRRELYHEDIIKSKVVTWFLSNPAVQYTEVFLVH